MNRTSALRCLLVVAAVLLVAIAPGTASAGSPPNDNFANAETLTGRFGYVDGSSIGATKEAGEPNHAGNPGGASVWYVWTAADAGRLTLDLCYYSDFDTLLAVYTGGQLVDLQEVASNNDSCYTASRVSFIAAADQTYRIAVDGVDGASGSFELAWRVAPPNDDFAQAVGLGGDSGSVSGDNLAATREAGEPDHGPDGGSSVWYRWTAPSSGPATFDVCSSSFDTLLAVYTGADVGGLTQVTRDDDACAYYGGSRVSFLATEGQTYSIAVDGSYGGQGDFALQWSRTAVAPRNLVSPTITGTLVDGSVLTAVVGEWGGTPPLTFSYQWARCSLQGYCTTIFGAAGATYTLTGLDGGTQMMVYVTATNAAGSTTALSLLTAIVSAIPPVNVTPPSISNTPYLNEEIIANEGVWTGSRPFSWEYQWQTCTSSGSCVNIEGEDTATYTVTAADLKKRLRVVVKATNSAGSASAASSLTRQAARLQFCVVPRLKGKALKAAKVAIRRAKCSVGRVRYARSAKARGRVMSQSPRPGVRKAVGTKVNLVIGRAAR